MMVPPQRILRKYGLSAQDYIKLWDLTGGHCPLCSKRFSLKRPAVIDHDHRTFLVRGLICQQCNWRVGEIHEDVGWMDATVRYLRYPPAEQVGVRAIHKDAPPVMEKD